MAAHLMLATSAGSVPLAFTPHGTSSSTISGRSSYARGTSPANRLVCRGSPGRCRACSRQGGTGLTVSRHRVHSSAASPVHQLVCWGGSCRSTVGRAWALQAGQPGACKAGDGGTANNGERARAGDSVRHACLRKPCVAHAPHARAPPTHTASMAPSCEHVTPVHLHTGMDSFHPAILLPLLYASQFETERRRASRLATARKGGEETSPRACFSACACP